MALDGGVAVDTFDDRRMRPTARAGCDLAGAGHRAPRPAARQRDDRGDRCRSDRGGHGHAGVSQHLLRADRGRLHVSAGWRIDRVAIRDAGRRADAARRRRASAAQARQDYRRALDEGKRAALLEQERDDVFTIQLGNLPPGEDATIRLTYSEELTFFDDGLTELRLPLVLGVRYVAGEPLPGASAGHGTEADTDIVPDASRITPPRLADGFDPGVHLAHHRATSPAAALDRPDVLAARDAARRRWRPHDDLAGATRRAAQSRFRPAVAGRGAGRRFASHAVLLPPAVRRALRHRVDGRSRRSRAESAARDVIFVLDRSGSMKGPRWPRPRAPAASCSARWARPIASGCSRSTRRPQWLIGDRQVPVRS